MKSFAEQQYRSETSNDHALFTVSVVLPVPRIIGIVRRGTGPTGDNDGD